jgi:cytochrome c5
MAWLREDVCECMSGHFFLVHPNRSLSRGNPVLAHRDAALVALPVIVPRAWSISGGSIAVLGSGCSVPQRGATAANFAQAQSGASEGSLIFQSYCAECHGSRDAGTLRYPALVGDQALARYGTALDLHGYVAGHMPQLGKAELAPNDYWALVVFLVLASDRHVPEGG